MSTPVTAADPSLKSLIDRVQANSVSIAEVVAIAITTIDEKPPNQQCTTKPGPSATNTWTITRDVDPDRSVVTTCDLTESWLGARLPHEKRIALCVLLDVENVLLIEVVLLLYSVFAYRFVSHVEEGYD